MLFIATQFNDTRIPHSVSVGGLHLFFQGQTAT